jgi:hypothetical protein
MEIKNPSIRVVHVIPTKTQGLRRNPFAVTKGISPQPYGLVEMTNGVGFDRSTIFFG